MFYSPKLFFKDWWIGMPFLASFLVQAFLWWYLLSHIKPTGEQIFLHYNTIFGVDLVGEWWKIFYLPAGGLFLLVVNCLFAWYKYASDRLLSRVLALWTVIASILLFIGIWLIAGMNI